MFLLVKMYLDLILEHLDLMMIKDHFEEKKQIPRNIKN